MLDIPRDTLVTASSLDSASKKCVGTEQRSTTLQSFRGSSHLRVEASPGQYITTISAYGKSRQWQQALSVLSEMVVSKVEPDVFSYSAGISACEKGKQWQWALALLSGMWEAKLEPNFIYTTIPGSARASSGRVARGGSPRPAGAAPRAPRPGGGPRRSPALRRQP